LPGRNLFLQGGRLPLVGVCFVVAVLLIWFAHRVAIIGVDVREDFWAYWAPYRVDDIQNALVHSDALLRSAEEISSPSSATIASSGPGLLDRPVNLHNLLERWRRLRPVYGQIIDAWVGDYDHPYPDRAEPMDYPPLRLLAVTLWTWHVQAEFRGLTRFPHPPQMFHDPTTGKTRLLTDEIARPLLTSNTACTAVGALEIFVLVWIWVRRGAKFDGAGWGDPMLLLPVAALGICAVLSRYLNWTMDIPNPATGPIDERFTSLSWWLFVALKFVSVVAIARFLPSPFRGPACGILAGTFFWLNPAIIIDSHGWPQWDPWSFPAFFWGGHIGFGELVADGGGFARRRVHVQGADSVCGAGAGDCAAGRGLADAVFADRRGDGDGGRDLRLAVACHFAVCGKVCFRRGFCGDDGGSARIVSGADCELCPGGVAVDDAADSAPLVG
jgi:hypothetical protein